MKEKQSAQALFELTTDHLETGLRGVPVGYCPTSLVHPEKGLFYRGYSIVDLVTKPPEAVIYLILNGELPTERELSVFKESLCENAHASKDILKTLQSYPKHIHPTKLFIAALTLVGAYDIKKDLRESGTQLIARITELTAWVYRVLNNWGPVNESKPELGYIENFVHMLAPPGVDIAKLTSYMKYFLILHLDHGGGNLSTFVGKVVASAHSDLSESLVAAMAGLAGPLHGKANQESLKFLKEAATHISDPDDEAQVEAFIRQKIAHKEKIFGFGHAVLRTEDLRATVQYDLGDKLCPSDPTFRLAKTFRKVGPGVLSEFKKISNPYPNVDAVSGCLLSALGLSDENYYTVLFGMARCIGITAQIFYDRLIARGGRGTPIVRPKYLYNGPVR
ncbi:citrate synthase [Spirochaetota bacterium]|nr:citrate synthase [Spirochaetota bacterium]